MSPNIGSRGSPVRSSSRVGVRMRPEAPTGEWQKGAHVPRMPRTPPPVTGSPFHVGAGAVGKGTPSSVPARTSATTSSPCTRSSSVTSPDTTSS